LLILLTSTIYAQNFPEPYCNIGEDDYSDVEEITAIIFDDFPIQFTPSLTDVLVDNTDVTLEVIQGANHSIKLAGNTYDDWNNKFVVFIDWNQNEIFGDDYNEIYDIGNIFNSTGYDEIYAEGVINVPDDAIVGLTRMRILKMVHEPDYEMYGISEPCLLLMLWGEEGSDDSETSVNNGQFVDISVSVSELLNTDKFNKEAIVIYPNPAKDRIIVQNTNTIDELLVYNIQGQLVNSIKNSNQIDISSLPIGQYFIKIESNGIITKKQFTKQ
jgi:hypothetical protein